METDYKMTIGLEIHAELKTKSKMFCGCANVPLERTPNIYACPICMGHPGTLPVINKEAVRKVLLVGSAVGGNLADYTEFDRKNYFYPDIPKGYQISQYKFPLVSQGKISNINLTRIHLEEDTARSTHETPGASLVDFNRAGVPLLELVTEPEIHSADQAMNFAKELQLILKYLDVSDANMEKGEMRVEVNISVAREGERGTKVEIKNINSFRAAGRAIEYEFKRQSDLLKRGESVIQETRGWNEGKQATISQRKKESAHDYRYFPDPDLPKLIISEVEEFKKDNLKKLLPELPNEKRSRLLKDFGIKAEDIEVYINNENTGKFFEEVSNELKDKELIKLASNYIVSDLSGLSKNSEDNLLGNVTKNDFVKLIKMIKVGDLSSRGAKDILKAMFEDARDPEVIANEKGLIQKNDVEEIKKLVEKILGENPEAVREFKSGKESLLQFFVGLAMKETKGSLNPEVFKKILLEYLK